MFRQLIAIIITTLSFGALAAVDANKASQAELESVKGIGTKMSTRIVDARKSGSFKDWNDMVQRVAGVGPGNAARLSQAGLTVAGTSYEISAMSAATAGDKIVSNKAGTKANTKADAQATDKPRKTVDSAKPLS